MVSSKEVGLLRRCRFPVLLVAFTVVMLTNAAIMQLVSPVVLLALPLGIGSVIAVLAGYRTLSRVVEQRVDIPELAEVRLWSQLRRGRCSGPGCSSC